MKNKALLILFIAFLSSSVFSQDYVPFPSPSDSVVYKESSSWWNGNNLQNSQWFYFLQGDSVVNGETYHLLYSANIPYLVDDFFTHLQGCIREVDKRIFYSDYCRPESKLLLYDFNLGVGDTIFIESAGGITGLHGYYALESIDTITINNGEYRRQYNYMSTYGNPATIIEGIGSTEGLLTAGGAHALLDGTKSLGCVTTPNEILYGPTTLIDPEVCLTLPIALENFTYTRLQTLPNPTTDIIHFTKNMIDVELEIYSSIGQKVRSQSGFKGTQINIAELPNGIYFLLLRGQENYFAKVIKH